MAKANPDAFMIPQALAVAALAFFSASFFFTHTFLPALTSVTHGFPIYYTSARLILEGQWSAKVYDNAWFGDHVQRVTSSPVREVINNQPPTTSMLLLPLAWLDHGTARIIWEWINLGLLLATLPLILTSLPQLNSFTVRSGFGALVFAYAPLAENFRLANVYVLLLFLFSFAFWGLTRAHVLTSAISLGIAAATKISGGPVWLLLLLRRRWHEILANTFVAFLICAASVALLGTAGWQVFLATLFTNLSTPGLAVTAFQTTSSFFQHLFVHNAQWNPHPVADLPWLAVPLALSITFAALGITLWRGKSADFDLALASTLTLGVILFPAAEEYHYVLLVLPLAIMLARINQQPWAFDIAWFTLTLFLLALPFQYKDEALWEGWASLLAYPRLYGGWLLWLWLYRQMVAGN